MWVKSSVVPLLVAGLVKFVAGQVIFNKKLN